MEASAEKRGWTWRSPKEGARNGSDLVQGARVSVCGHGGCALRPTAADPHMAMARASPSRMRVDTRNPSDTGRLAVKLRCGDEGVAHRSIGSNARRVRGSLRLPDGMGPSRGQTRSRHDLARRSTMTNQTPRGRPLVVALLLAALVTPARADLEAEAGPVVAAAHAETLATNLGRYMLQGRWNEVLDEELY